MKAKTINKIITKKHKEFVDSIEDEEIQKLVEENSIVTGGAIVSMLLDEPVNDYDYYFTDALTTYKVAQYFVDKYKERRPSTKMQVENKEDRVSIRIDGFGMAGNLPPEQQEESEPQETEEEEKESDEEKYQPVFFTSNAITLTDDVQIVTRFFGNPQEIHNNYDFVHTKCYWSSRDNHLELPQESLLAILTKELRYEGSKYPLASIFRTRKFIERGWTVNAGQYLKMALQLNDLNLKDMKVLEEQLTGVDLAYFQSVLEIIKKDMEEEEKEELDSAYLIEVINKVFD